ncbi:MAG TPA: hypothetical protein VFE06_06230 [Acidobacteriaceae bacterium]|jgi:hypothetical protein|nr:hypothetical protein [Acidobacteriaceae bacterium]
MVANSDRNCPLLRRLLVVASAVAVSCTLPVAAQTAATSNLATDAQSSSSSVTLQASLSTDDLLGGSPTPYHFSLAAANGSPQYGGGRNNSPRYPNYESRASHIAIVAGGGFTGPIGNDTSGYDTWGYNLDFGGGWNFNKKFGVVFEYQFDRNKIPGATIAAIGAQGGNINTHLFLFDPIYYFYTSKKTGAYVTGGGGFSRKVTNFTDLQSVQQCYYFCYYGYAPVTVASFSSTQGAFDIGLGGYWKAFGRDSNAKLFAEARYVWVDSPKPTSSTNGEGTEGLIPVTVGIRF